MARRIQVVEHDSEEESSEAGDEDMEHASSSDDDGDEVEEEEVASVVVAQAPARAQKLKITLTKSEKIKKGVCKVCGQSGHLAGFNGAVYMDCPNKPCFLCKQVGHTTMQCPFRVDAQGSSKGAATLLSGGGDKGTAGGTSVGSSPVARLRQRECLGRASLPPPPPAPPRYQVEAAVLKLHTRRCCSLEFHPTNDSIVVSGDKKGQLAIWNYDQVHERTVYSSIHRALLNTLRFAPWLGHAMTCVTAAGDGLVKVVDLETGESRQLVDLNVNRTPGSKEEWLMMVGLDVVPSLGVAITGDSDGRVHVLDARLDDSGSSSGGASVAPPLRLHKPGSKVVSVCAHPLIPHIIMTGGNDHAARIFDVRRMSSNGEASTSAAGSAGGKVPKSRWAPHASQLVDLPHGRVVNAAYFSPLTGHKVMTTCQDNRIRIWDYALNVARPADREIVHSHDFNRYLTPFKAEWDHKDLGENTFVVGRYISEDFGGVALHPVDLIDARSGRLLQQLVDTNLTTISPVNKMHPRRDLIVSGSSRSLYLWAPAQDDDDSDALHVGAAAGGSQQQAGGSGAAALGPELLARLRATRFNAFDADPDSGGKKSGGKKAPTARGGGEGKGKKGAGKRPAESDSD